MSRRLPDAKKSKNIKLRLAASALALSALFGGLAQVIAQPAPAGASRLALVIGEASYRTGPISSAANDAGLVADTLQQAGFDVTGAADLDQESLRKSLREFVEKAASAGPDAVVFIYLSGRAVQYAGENYLAPIEASIPQATNVPLEAVRLNDYLQPLSQLPLKARIFVLDAARANSFAATGAPLAGGLALVEPNVGGLYAFNAAPDTVAPEEKGPYGVYAQSLTEMMREGGLPLDEAFARTRLRVSERTKGAQVPWDESKLSPAPVLFARAVNAPPPAVPMEAQANLRAKPIRDFPVDEAFAAALEQDTISAYVDFLNAYPNSRYAARVRAMLAMRREAVTWRRAYMANTASAYWTYLQRYRNGPHAEDARRRLEMINAALTPPPRFEVYEFDVPPPVESEDVYFRRRSFTFDDDDYGPPPPMSYLLPPPPMLIEEAPPPPPRGLLPLPLLAAPLLFAVPAVRHGLFRAPSTVQQQQPAAQNYYGSRNAQAPVPPTGTPGAPAGGAPFGGAPAAPNAPAAPAAPGAGAPQPHQGAPVPAPGAGAPQPHQGAPVPPPAPGAGAPLPHQGAPVPPPAPGAGAPQPHQGAPVPPPAPGAGAPLPHQGAPVPPPGAAPHHVSPVAPAPGAVHTKPPAPAHVAPPAPSAPVHAPPPAHAAPLAPHAAPVHAAPPPAVRAAPPAPVHAAPPPPHPAPVHAPPAPVHVAPPPLVHAAPPAARPAPPHPAPALCGGHGEPPCH